MSKESLVEYLNILKNAQAELVRKLIESNGDVRFESAIISAGKFCDLASGIKAVEAAIESAA